MPGKLRRSRVEVLASYEVREPAVGKRGGLPGKALPRESLEQGIEKRKRTAAAQREAVAATKRDLEQELIAAARRAWPSGPIPPPCGGLFFRLFAERFGLLEDHVRMIAQANELWPWVPRDVVVWYRCEELGEPFVHPKWPGSPAAAAELK